MPKPIIEVQRCGQGGRRNAHENGVGDDGAPRILHLGDSFILELGVIVIRFFNPPEEHRPNDTSSAPHECDPAIIQVPLIILRGLTHEHEPLGIGDDLSGVEGLSELTTGKYGLTYESDRNAAVEGVDSGPFACSLLSGGVADAFDEWLAVLVLEAEDVASYFDQVRVKVTLVPGFEDFRHLFVREVETGFHNVVGLGDELHVTILNAVVHHLDVVARASLANPVAARFAIHSGGGSLEYGFDVLPVEVV
ncbi:hypothetical protein BC938DRAFT_471104 [Jimgerdemannia flammicorona]|uniref:Uncharacterized protein n=1 Tax=Jimgerdemannia flammicorona TaxID=994334 RepID=A0A433Q8W2_9FUNG|nr:hypothetical protein BC938DRAFT_471104 [Jimgerdemannia flammicorona]